MKKNPIAVIGLGYVGLPLAVEFGRKRKVLGFDINKKRIDELKNGHDATLEVNNYELKSSTYLHLTNNINDLKICNIFIITVPTPIDENKKPNLLPLKNASKIIGRILKKEDIVIYESTVYPGVTEEVCVPILEKESGLFFNVDFYCGYSPERINPGDKEHSLTRIKKIVSGSTAETANIVDRLYQEIIKAGTHKTESIKIAEAAKVIENVQRDINIALVNEFALIFNKLNIDTEAILKAAGTKWNFMHFKPGLVGGHCIGVDPYYLAHKANDVGYYPEIILAGRRLNDSLPVFIVNQVLTLMKKKSILIRDAKVLVMGITFKENCPDIRNSGTITLVNEFKKIGCVVDAYDPWVDKEKLLNLQIKKIDKLQEGKYDVIMLAVPHDNIKKISFKQIKALGKQNHVLYDIKYLLKSDEVDGRL